MINEKPDFRKMAETLLRDAGRYAAVEGKNFFKDSFQKEGFTNEAFEPWQKGGKKSGATLMGRGILRDSIEYNIESISRIVFGTDEPYAEIHNNGGIIPITKKARKYFWFMFKETGDTKWKAMALTKKQAFIMPKRQFIGESATLMRDLDKWITEQISTRFKQL